MLNQYISNNKNNKDLFLSPEENSKLKKGEKYWILKNNSEGNGIVYYEKLINVINKIELRTKTSLNMPKIYVFTLSDAFSKYGNLFIYSDTEIYNSYEELFLYRNVNKVSISYSWSAVIELHKQNLIGAK